MDKRGRYRVELIRLGVLIIVFAAALIGGNALLHSGHGAKAASKGSGGGPITVTDADAKAMALVAKGAMDKAGAHYGGNWTGATVGDIRLYANELDPKRLQASGNEKTYVLSVSADTGEEFSVERESSGHYDYTCRLTGVGGCPTNGIWK